MEYKGKEKIALCGIGEQSDGIRLKTKLNIQKGDRPAEQLRHHEGKKRCSYLVFLNEDQEQQNRYYQNDTHC